jgi:hypothetical protein
MSILITAASSAQAYQLKSILNTDVEVLLGDYLELPESMLRSGKMVKTPHPSSNTFIHEMLALCLDKGIEEVFTLRTAELTQLVEAEQLFREFNITLFVPSKEMIIADQFINIGVSTSILVIQNGNVIAGDKNALPPPGENLNGVFKGSKIFTAD